MRPLLTTPTSDILVQATIMAPLDNSNKLQTDFQFPLLPAINPQSNLSSLLLVINQVR